ncbi:MAG: U32 family peptidase, partial [Rhodocyclaceae bacterium]|nr:U32 family peptidase [Rhodocyclaceae bacterium]
WPRQATLDFYAEVARLPFDIVYLGETVCSRRHELRADDWLEVAAQLADAGKEVVLSSQALIESESDLKALRRLVDNNWFAVEANEMGAVRLLAEKNAPLPVRPVAARADAAGTAPAAGDALGVRLPWVAGMSLNVFNGHTLGLLAGMGATRWVMPPEASRETLAGVMEGKPPGVETEVFAYGRLPLAWSARCFTARRFNLQKDTCEFRCVEFPDGMLVKTREHQEFLVLNGVQTLSSKTYNLLREIPQLAAAGVDIVRLSPQAQGLPEVVSAFRRALGGEAAQLSGDYCNGFWHGKPGLELVENQ